MLAIRPTSNRNLPRKCIRPHSLKYIEYKAEDDLSDYIQLVWIAESESEYDHYPKERVLPDGIVEIIFHFAEPFITHRANGDKVKQPKGFAISQMKNFIEIESDGEIGFISVRFYPWRFAT